MSEENETTQNGELAAPYLHAMLKATEFKAEMLRIATLAVKKDTSPNAIYDAIVKAREVLDQSLAMAERSIFLSMANESAGGNGITLPDFARWEAEQKRRRFRIRRGQQRPETLG